MAINRDKPTTTTTTTKPATPAATFSPEALTALLNEVSESRKLMATQMAEITALKAEMQAKPQAASSVSAKNDIAVLRVFKKAGFSDVKPRQNILTFNKWRELDRRPLEGSKSLKINGLRLFHISQTRPLTKEELAAPQGEKPAPKAKVVPINQPSA